MRRTINYYASSYACAVQLIAGRKVHSLYLFVVMALYHGRIDAYPLTPRSPTPAATCSKL
jgi:hypothetical protein